MAAGSPVQKCLIEQTAILLNVNTIALVVGDAAFFVCVSFLHCFLIPFPQEVIANLIDSREAACVDCIAFHYLD
jgi:hypothetical protein